MKKLFSIILCIVFCLSFFTLVSAEDEITLNIADGGEISTDFPAIEGTVSSVCESIIFYLDGEKTAEAENTDAFSFELKTGDLYAGYHTIEIVAITEDGTVYEKAVSARAKEVIETVAIDEDFSSYTSGDKLPSGMGAVLQSSVHNTVVEKAEGVNGEGDTAVRLSCDGIVKSSKPYINAPFAMITKFVQIEFDIKLDNTNTQAYIEMQNGGGGNAAYYFAKPKNSYIFDQSGKFFGGETEYKANVWYHLKGTIDFTTKEQNLTVYDYETQETITLLENAISTDADCTQIKLARINLASPDKEGCGYTLDNVNIKGIENYSGIKDVKYKNADGDEKALINAVKPSDINSINVYLADALIDGVNVSDVLSITSGNDVIEFEGAVYDKDAKCINIASPKLKEGTKYFIKIPMSAFTTTKLDESKTTGYNFKTGFNGFGVADGQILVNGSKYFVPTQFKTTNTVSAKANISAGEEAENVIVILTVRDGKKIVSMKAVEVSPSQGETKETEISIEDVGAVAEPKMQCMILDNLTLRQAKVPAIVAE